MTLPVVPGSSMSFSQINTELGLTSTATISLNDAAVRTLAGVGASPATISITNLSGKSNQFAFTVSANQTNANLRVLAISAGWNQNSKLIATINGGVTLSSNSTGVAALTITGSFPGGVQLTNNGTITGMGGAGGTAASLSDGSVTSSQTNGGTGGTALSVSSPVTINNAGTLQGGGGGGGAGESTALYVNVPSCCAVGWETYGGGGGGGGRSSTVANSAAGGGGSASSALFARSGVGGGGGTSGGAGGGGAGGKSGSFGAGNGSSGGGYGTAGTAGVARSTGSYANQTSATLTQGGSGGPAVSGNSNITWTAFGTRIGPIT